MRLGRVPIDEAVLDAFDDAANLLAQSLERLAHNESQPQTQALVERLRGLSATREASRKNRLPCGKVLAALPEEIARSLSEHEAHRLHESVEEGARLLIVAINFELATFDESFRSLSDTLSEDGEIISTLPGLETASPDKIGFRIVYATKTSREELAAHISAYGQSALTALVGEKPARPEATGRRLADAPAFAESALPENQSRRSPVACASSCRSWTRSSTWRTRSGRSDRRIQSQPRSTSRTMGKQSGRTVGDASGAASSSLRRD